MEVKRLILILMAVVGFSACTSQGTEVLSPANPNESPSQQKIETLLYEMTVDLPAGWTFKEYGPDVTPGPETFEDIDPETITVAQFNKGDSGFTIFYSSLDSGTLEDFVRARRPVGELEIEKVEDEDNAYTAIFFQEEPGPHEGLVIDVYIAVDQYILWMRTEAVGTQEEQETLLTEFFEVIVPSIEFQPKK